MAKPGGPNVVGSLFDRLTDSEPRRLREVPPTLSEQLRLLKGSSARDLTDLLNARRSEADIPEEFEQTRDSVVAYGVQDFTTAPMDREAVRTAIERSVRRFEPRLTRVQVTMAERSEFVFAFRISGVLRAELGVEPVVYDAELPVESRRFKVAPGR
jgi:type VI secretion system protein ImpF